MTEISQFENYTNFKNGDQQREDESHCKNKNNYDTVSVRLSYRTDTVSV